MILVIAVGLMGVTAEFVSDAYILVQLCMDANCVIQLVSSTEVILVVTSIQTE